MRWRDAREEDLSSCLISGATHNVFSSPVPKPMNEQSMGKMPNGTLI
jgi:hypothetical protein